MNKESTKKVTDYTPEELLKGGEMIRIPCVDGSTMDVFVRQVRPRELTAYLQAEAAGDEALIELTCRVGKDGAVPLDDITLDGFEALLEADNRQNFTAARAKEKRDTARALRQIEALRDTTPEAYDALMRKQSELLESLTSSLAPSSLAPGAGPTAATK